ncbi:MAG: 2-hydroxy-3-oxopropionate reductase [Halobacteriales archaeon]
MLFGPAEPTGRRMTSPTVGFIGLGIMGLPMASNLVAAGYDVVGHNRSPEPVETLVDRGGDGAETARETAERADVVITCLPDTDTVERVVRKDDGVLAGAEAGTTLIDMSTISPTTTEALAAALEERGVAMLDAPISGGERGAIEGTLSIMVGGDPAVLEANRELLEVMGSTVTHCGPSGSGQVAKACNQIVVAGTYLAVSEALVFAAKAGADLQAVVDAISGGAAGCWVLDNRADRMIRGNFEPGFFADYQYKDLRIATEAAQAYGAPLFATATAHELFKAMSATGLGRADHSAVIQMLERLAGAEARLDGAA